MGKLLLILSYIPAFSVATLAQTADALLLNALTVSCIFSVVSWYSSDF